MVQKLSISTVEELLPILSNSIQMLLVVLLGAVKVIIIIKFCHNLNPPTTPPAPNLSCYLSEGQSEKVHFGTESTI